ncbi:MAG: hypothetical protein KJ706_08700 [Candidatus Omnitrophica bacterium]|nr:hypothetical protein [Candidatus Omnitrophota bacterium]
MSFIVNQLLKYRISVLDKENVPEDSITSPGDIAKNLLIELVKKSVG